MPALLTYMGIASVLTSTFAPLLLPFLSSVSCAVGEEEEGAPYMACVMALPRVSNQSCMSSEPSACSNRTREGDVTLKEKFLSVSFTSAG